MAKAPSRHRITVEVEGTDTLAVEAASAAVEYARAHGGRAVNAAVTARLGESDEAVLSVGALPAPRVA